MWWFDSSFLADRILAANATDPAEAGVDIDWRAEGIAGSRLANRRSYVIMAADPELEGISNGKAQYL